MSANKDYPSLPLGEFLADLAGRSPTPGGGSVAALVGALAAAQAPMVIEYTVGKARWAEKEPRLRELLEEFKRARDMFVQLMSEDMAAYERLAASGRADDAGERERAVAVAAAVPMEVVALASAVAARLDEIKSFVNPYLLSDLHVAAVLAHAAARSAGMNVRINLDQLADRKEAEQLANQLDTLLARTARHHDAVVQYQAR